MYYEYESHAIQWIQLNRVAKDHSHKIARILFNLRRVKCIIPMTLRQLWKCQVVGQCSFTLFISSLIFKLFTPALKVFSLIMSSRIIFPIVATQFMHSKDTTTDWISELNWVHLLWFVFIHQAFSCIFVY